jgi:hypothetical protein
LYLFAALIAIGVAFDPAVILNEVKDLSKMLWITLIMLAYRELRARGPSLRSG